MHEDTCWFVFASARCQIIISPVKGGKANFKNDKMLKGKSGQIYLCFHSVGLNELVLRLKQIDDLCFIYFFFFFLTYT